MEHQYLKNIKEGMRVGIMTSRKKYAVGIVDEIAARTPFHEEGIMVRLKNGEVGRVKKIILSEPEQQEKIAAEIKKILAKGEDFHTEFKTSAFWSVVYNPEKIKESKSFELREYGQKASKVIIAKGVAAFLNSDGGNLIIGVNENKETETFDIVGIEDDLKKIGARGTDHYKRILIDELLRTFFPSKFYNHLNDYVEIIFVVVEGKTVCWLKIRASDFRIFLKINNQELFMIRVETENRSLIGEKLVDYCLTHWKGR